MQRHGKVRQHIFPVQDPVARFHVQQFDGENIRGAPQLLQSKNQRWALPASNPPLHRGMQRFQMRRVRLSNETKDIEIRMLGVKLFGGRRTVQDHRLQIVSGRSLQLLHQFVELMIDQLLLLPALLRPARNSPTPARAATAKRSSTEAAKSAATTSAAPGTSAP